MPAPNPLFDLAGTAALVTGGNGGIGRGIALGLAAAGADIVVAARNEEKTRAVVAEIEACGRRAMGVACDVLQREHIDAAVERARSEFGRLDILVNNAGVAGGGPPQSLPEETWDRVVGTNLKAVFQCSQAAFPLLKEGGRGKVINIGSEYSLFGSPNVLPYSASKGGVIQLTKSLAAAWARDGIQVNAIIPGWITTDMTAGAKSDETFYNRIVARTPARRFGEPEELAGAAVFLASHASDFVTGQSVAVDGGYSIA
ncbi:MAG: glucose 1-dehydrogenase [Dehalococcoidia bacterium]|nr:glucose 1-dehydrogenase [Dehalococcoidia bacterium]